MLFKAPNVIGFVIDLTVREMPHGKRLIDCVKKSLLAFVRSIDEDDGCYLHDSGCSRVVYRQGEQVAAIAGFETDGFKFDLSVALKQTLFTLAAEDDDSPRFLFLITDRLEDIRPLKKLVMVNTKEDYACQFIVVCIGPCCNTKAIEAQPGISFVHLDNEIQLEKELLRFLQEKNGSSKDTCSETA